MVIPIRYAIYIMRRNKLQQIVFNDKNSLWPGWEFFLETLFFKRVTIYLREDGINYIYFLCFGNPLFYVFMLASLMSVTDWPFVLRMSFTDIDYYYVDFIFESLV